MPGMPLQADSRYDSVPGADHAATSFGQALQICLTLQSDAAKSAEVIAG